MNARVGRSITAHQMPDNSAFPFRHFTSFNPYFPSFFFLTDFASQNNFFDPFSPKIRQKSDFGEKDFYKNLKKATKKLRISKKSYKKLQATIKATKAKKATVRSFKEATSGHTEME